MHSHKENVVKKIIVQKLAESWGKATRREQLDCGISEVQENKGKLISNLSMHRAGVEY